MKYLGIITAWMTLAFFSLPASAQSARRARVSEAPESLRQMLATQPNYTAIQRMIFSEGFGGHGSKSKVAKLGHRQAEVTEETIFIHEPGKPTIKVFPQRKEYAEMALDKGGDFAITPEELARRNDVLFSSLGTEKVGEHSCTKIEATYKDKKLKGVKFLFWAAPGLNNLVVKSEISLGPRVKFLTLLENISLDVDAELFRVPADYKKVVEPDDLKELQERIQKPR